MWLQRRQVEAASHHVYEKALYKSHWLNAKRAVTAGTAKPCVRKLDSLQPQRKKKTLTCETSSQFCVDMARRQLTEGFSDDLAAYIAGTLFEAGSDTTGSTLYGFAQGMLLYPDAQRKAQSELDAVVGASRLPELEDAPRLPYVVACVKEAMRWMPTAVLGAAPHAVMEDDEYLGYHIPKGAGVMMNIWGIHRDEKRYPQPERFWPDRYEGDVVGIADSASLPDASKRDQFGFGAGRRICQGESALFRLQSLMGGRLTGASQACMSPSVVCSWESPEFFGGSILLLLLTRLLVSLSCPNRIDLPVVLSCCRRSMKPPSNRALSSTPESYERLGPISGKIWMRRPGSGPRSRRAWLCPSSD